MYFKQFYLSCLAHASYLIGADDEAAVVDPQRDVEQYIAEATARGFKIKYVIETHLHADFVSGHRELAARTGAEVVFGAQAGAGIPHRAVKDGDELRVGRVLLRIMETPGHTPEGISLLVIDPTISDKPQKVLTGDTLFIGDVGRPDLAGGRGYTSEMMAGMLYNSLHDKLLKLDDAVEVYPAHGAGSMCGRNMSKETSSTIGQQRQFNYALKPMPRTEFVKLMTADLPEQPAYFARDAEINRTGAQALSELPRPVALTPAEIEQQAAEGAVLLDVRAAAEFGAEHVPGSLNIGLGGQFAIWAGCLIPFSAPVVIIATHDEQVAEAVLRLARVGIERVRGYLRGGVEAWRASGRTTASVPQISVAELKQMLDAQPRLQVLDVRRPPEYTGGHVPAARSAPLAQLEKQIANLNFDPARPLAVICAGGYRSSAATSILARHGYTDLLNVTGGTSAWIAAGFETTVTSDE
ncbi:MAG TPA: MBL fold metallo-hydrolase [Pyrinomonadaceae bacterium]